MDRTTLTVALKPLIRRNLVAVAMDTADRRNRRLVLTVAGRELLATVLPIWESEHVQIEGLVADPNSLRAQLRAIFGCISGS